MVNVIKCNEIFSDVPLNVKESKYSQHMYSGLHDFLKVNCAHEDFQNL